MSKLLIIWLLVFATSILFTVLDSRALFYLFWSAIAVAYVAWCIWVFRYSRKIKRDSAVVDARRNEPTRPMEDVLKDLGNGFIVPVLYHRAYAEYLEFVHTCETAHVAVPTFECWKNLSAPFVCFYCEQPIVPPTRWLPVPGELQKKLCSKCYDSADVV